MIGGPFPQAKPLQGSGRGRPRLMGGRGPRAQGGGGGGPPSGTWGLSAPQRSNAERSDAQRNFFTSQFIPLFLQRHRCDALPCFFQSIARDYYFLHRAHRLSAFASIFPFATMVYCTKQQEMYQESQRSDVATGNAGWPSQTQTQTL